MSSPFSCNASSLSVVSSDYVTVLSFKPVISNKIRLSISLPSQSHSSIIRSKSKYLILSVLLYFSFKSPLLTLLRLKYLTDVRYLRLNQILKARLERRQFLRQRAKSSSFYNLSFATLRRFSLVIPQLYQLPSRSINFFRQQQQFQRNRIARKFMQPMLNSFYRYISYLKRLTGFSQCTLELRLMRFSVSEKQKALIADFLNEKLSQLLIRK